MIIHRKSLIVTFISALSTILFGQIRIVDFDKASFKNGIVYDRQANWKTVFSRLSPKEIDGTPSLLIDYRSVRPLAVLSRGIMQVDVNT